MTYNPAFEVPAQRSGEVISHDRYTPAQLELFEVIEAFGRSKVAEMVEIDAETSVDTVEATGQYL